METTAILVGAAPSEFRRRRPYRRRALTSPASSATSAPNKCRGARQRTVVRVIGLCQIGIPSTRIARSWPSSCSRLFTPLRCGLTRLRFEGRVKSTAAQSPRLTLQQCFSAIVSIATNPALRHRDLPLQCAPRDADALGPPSVPQARHDAGFVATPKRKRPPRGPAAVVHFKSQKFATRSVVQVLVARNCARPISQSRSRKFPSPRSFVVRSAENANAASRFPPAPFSFYLTISGNPGGRI